VHAHGVDARAPVLERCVTPLMMAAKFNRVQQSQSGTQDFGGVLPE
jgi:hypothetical protein